ncbi:MAG: UPF0280 family protein [Candidatus Omnitrophica bacterium]|nr:UPF0280 family protein [Candidatus Omnitrophota bacterium]
MKTDSFQRRFYRDWVKAKDLYLTRIAAKETDLYILTNKPLDKNYIEQRIFSYRWDIEKYISKDHRFLTALKPLSVEINAPEIVRDMSREATKANVGPMASVAGAIAGFLGNDLLKKKYKDVIIENGGDIFLKTTKARKIGIYAGKSKLWNRLSIKINAKDTPISVCTSSGTIGHSLSFGCADSVIILSKNSSLADAVATATANIVQSKNDLQKALDFARKIKGVIGVVIILKNNLVSWGKVEFVK